MEKPVILDANARKFWKKYFGEKSIDFDYFWECLQQEWGEKLDRYDLVQIERMITKELDRNRNNQVTDIEFNQWTRKKGLDSTFEAILKASKTTEHWEDDEDGQWGQTDDAQRVDEKEREYKSREASRRGEKKKQRDDDYRRRQKNNDSDEDDRRRGRGRDDSDDGRRRGSDSEEAAPVRRRGKGRDRRLTERDQETLDEQGQARRDEERRIERRRRTLRRHMQNVFGAKRRKCARLMIGALHSENSTEREIKQNG